MSAKPRFAHRPNQPFDAGGGRIVFDSRSVAITAIVVAFDERSRVHHALVGRRGPAVDFSGLWCLVCGYLDWDESLPNAVRREVFEEAGVDLHALEAAGAARVPEQPLFVQSDPASHRQNVTARFLVELSERPLLTTENAEPNEVAELRWIEVARGPIASLEWAFGHDRILAELADFYAAEHTQGSLDAGSTRRFHRRFLERRYPFDV